MAARGKRKKARLARGPTSVKAHMLNFRVSDKLLAAINRVILKRKSSFTSISRELWIKEAKRLGLWD